MRIGEVAEVTGLSISNIRFYEKKGLIGPNREEESKYRNYSEEDVKRLQHIILLRKMDLSVDVISKLLSAEISYEDALEEQLLHLKAQQLAVEDSIALCQKMIQDHVDQELDIEFYANYVREEEAKGKIFMQIDDLLEDASTFTGYQRVFGDTDLAFWIYRHPWINRCATLLWVALFLFVPIIGIIELIMDTNHANLPRIMIFVLYFLAVWGAFWNYRRMKKK